MAEKQQKTGKTSLDVNAIVVFKEEQYGKHKKLFELHGTIRR